MVDFTKLSDPVFASNSVPVQTVIQYNEFFAIVFKINVVSSSCTSFRVHFPPEINNNNYLYILNIFS